jgi:hypothetical protein
MTPWNAVISHKSTTNQSATKRLFVETKLPNRKQLDLSKTKAQLFNQVPDAASP